MRTKIVASLFVAIALSNGLASVAATAAPGDPPVPPRDHSAGTPVALICTGIDYTREHVAQMLARDGEGEIIGYDFVDDDRRPFKSNLLGQKSYINDITDVSEIIRAEGQAATLVPIRANLDDVQSIAKAIGYAAQTPAKIIAIEKPLMGEDFISVVTAASKRFSDHLFVVPVGNEVQEAGANGKITVPDIVLPNVILPTIAWPGGELSRPRPFLPDDLVDAFPGIADVAVPLDSKFSRAASHASLGDGSVAFARLAALAVRLHAAEPSLNGAAMKARILSLAKPLPGKPDKRTRNGWIAEPMSHFLAK
jgi:hypothetical protein